MASAVVIGIGSSGLHIIEQAQQFHYEFTGKNKPDTVQYLYLETDPDETSILNPLGKTDIESCFINIQNTNAEVGILRKNTQIDPNWIPSADVVTDVIHGANGLSTLGRTALWLSLSKVLNKISLAYNLVTGNSSTTFIIVGSLTGGTGSGLLLDIAYLINKRFQNKNIHGLFLLPSKSLPLAGDNLSFFVNTYAAFASLENFSKSNHNKFTVNYPEGTNINTKTRPFFQPIQFISQDFANGDASLNSLPDLFTMAGLSLVIKLIGIDNVKNSPRNLFLSTALRRIADFAGKQDEGDLKYTSCGMLLIQYPKAKLEQMVAIDILRDNLFNRWLNSKNYIDSNKQSQSITALKNSLEPNAKEDLETALIAAIMSGKGHQFLGKSNVSTCVDEDITQIIEGTTKRASNAHFMYQRFASETDDNYFQAIDNQHFDLRDHLIGSIYSLIESKMAIYQNLYVLDIYIDYLCKAIEKLKNFWKKEYGLTGDAPSWNKILISISEKVDNSIFGSLMQKENYLKNLNKAIKIQPILFGEFIWRYLK